MMQFLIKIRQIVLAAARMLWGGALFLYQHKREKRVWIPLIIVLVLLGYATMQKKSPAAESIVSEKTVTLKTSAEFAASGNGLPIVGLVKSVSQATLQAQSQGVVMKVYRGVGDYVGAGAIIAELENSAQRAALLQAQGVLEASLGSNSRDQKLANEASIGGVNTLLSTFDTVNDVIRNKTDVMFSNPESSVPQFLLTTSNSQLVTTIANQRQALTAIVEGQESRRRKLSTSSDLIAELDRAEREVRTVQDYVENINAALNSSIPTTAVPTATIDTWKTNAATARTNLNTALSSISSARDSWHTKTALGGATNSINDAALKQAQAAVLLAQSNLEKTIIRAPISGQINSLTLEIGNFVSLYQPVAVIANNGALMIESYVTESDRAMISIGSKANVEGKYHGVVSEIAPGIDPATKKIKIKILLSDSNVALTSGQSASVTLERSKQTTLQNDTKVIIPISAVKILPDGQAVLTVVDNKIVENKVELGPLLGEKVYILRGVTADMKMVTDARGLKQGDVVRVIE